MVRRNIKPFHSQTNEIVKVFEKLLHRGFSRSNLFNDWLDLMIYALTGDEENYMQLVNKYPNKNEKGNREIDLFADMFGLLIKAMTETDADILGDFFESQISWGEHGQFFTPENVCLLMAKIVGNSDNGKAFNDPCCGSGRMALAYGKVNNKTIFVNQDIDLRCVKMCALNMCFYNLDSVMYLGNSLLMESKPMYRTKKTSLGGVIERIKEEDKTPSSLKMLAQRYQTMPNAELNL